MQGEVYSMKYSKILTVTSIGVCLAIVSGCGGAEKTPDAVVLQVTKAINDNQPQVLFQALPDSYQKDINSLVSDAAKKMDGEIWTEGRGLIQSILTIAKTKKELILNTQMLASAPDKEALNKSWDESIGVLTMLLDSDLADLDQLRKGNVANLLADSGSKIMKKAAELYASQPDQADNILKKISGIKATVVSQEGDSAKVKIETEGETPEEIDFVRVEGKWIPKDLADGFATQIAEIRENLAELDYTTEEGKATKTQILGQIAMVKTVLEQAEAAQTSADFDGILMGLMMGIMMGGEAPVQ
jgi:hypothetical protein